MSKPLRSNGIRRGWRQLCTLAVVLLLSSACTGGYQLVPQARAPHLAAGVAWVGPALRHDVETLMRWRAAVGSPLVDAQPDHPVPPTADSITIVSWNVALGAGDVVAFVRELRQNGSGPIVLLLQEAFRSGDDIPTAPLDAAFAGFLGNSDDKREVDAVAEELGLALYYVPSMRNGSPGRHDEDRGNAILSDLPIEDLTAIELPFERQRRVAVAARLHGRTSGGEAWSLRVASVHLDNTASLKRFWIGSEYGRARQARGLSDALRGEDPLVVGGDFNTWFGFSDLAYKEIARAFPDTDVRDTRRTFRGLLRLDHVFYRVEDDWRVEVARAETARGSDHHPLITRITF